MYLHFYYISSKMYIKFIYFKIYIKNKLLRYFILYEILLLNKS